MQHATDTLRDRLARSGKSALMTPNSLTVLLSDPRYTPAQKRAHFEHAARVANDAGDRELYRSAVDLARALEVTPTASLN